MRARAGRACTHHLRDRSQAEEFPYLVEAAAQAAELPHDFPERAVATGLDLLIAGLEQQPTVRRSSNRVDAPKRAVLAERTPWR
jgi:hypothetical protein